MPIPWPTLMAFGLGALKLPPDQFWQMTLQELFHAMNATGRGDIPLGVPQREDLERLMTAFPDY